jgi:hypothetical protein
MKLQASMEPGRWGVQSAEFDVLDAPQSDEALQNLARCEPASSFPLFVTDGQVGKLGRPGGVAILLKSVEHFNKVRETRSTSHKLPMVDGEREFHVEPDSAQLAKDPLVARLVEGAEYGVRAQRSEIGNIIVGPYNRGIVTAGDVEDEGIFVV